MFEEWLRNRSLPLHTFKEGLGRTNNSAKEHNLLEIIYSQYHITKPLVLKKGSCPCMYLGTPYIDNANKNCHQEALLIILEEKLNTHHFLNILT